MKKVMSPTSEDQKELWTLSVNSQEILSLTVKKDQLIRYGGIIAILLGLFLYNHYRIWGYPYDFNILRKFEEQRIIVSLIPFYRISSVFEYLGGRTVWKVLFFALEGLLIKLTLRKFALNKEKYYLISCFCFILLVEALVILTSGHLFIPIDMNNIIFYTCGLLMGWILFRVLDFIKNFIYKRYFQRKKDENK